MCDNPNNTEAVHHPARSLFDDRAKKFCSNPRNSNSSGQAVKNKIASEVNSNELQRFHCGAKAIKRIAIPSGIAMHPNTAKLPATYNPQFFPHPIEYPIPFARRTTTNVATATFTATSTVIRYASFPPGNGHTKGEGQ